MKLFLTIALVILSTLLKAQDTLDINLKFKHIVGDVSEFDRNKFMIFHEDLDGKEWESNDMKKAFLEDNDLYLGRNNGGIVWEWNNTREDTNKPGWPDIDYLKTRATNSKNNYASNTFIHQFENRYDLMMIGGQEHMFPHGQATNQGGLIYENYEATAEFYAHYIKEFYGTGGTTGRPKPKMLEVINEPFVKAGKLGTTNEELSKYHNVIAARVKELNPEIMVGGYTAAHPAFESNNFGHWDNTWKLFIDVAGENMDFFSFHLYDVTLDDLHTGTITKRAGSNIEAIMDMINHYSMIKLGELKPFSISEYGWFVKDYEGDYDPLIDWYNIRSFNNMMLQLMERQDQIINAIPFVLLKALWAHPEGKVYNNYQSRLMRQVGELPEETQLDDPTQAPYMFTDIIKFYEFWNEVSGTRIDTKTTDFDMLSDAYINGKKLYLILSNLNSEDREIKLNFFDDDAYTLQNIEVKELFLDVDKAKIQTTNYTDNIDFITLKSEATMILEYTFNEDLGTSETISEKDYYATTYLQTIAANSERNFIINNVDVADNGEAILRIGLGRDHNLSLKPIVKINDHELRVPEDWRGYDQSTRDRFFGVLEVPVPYEYLQANNTISLEFNDAGGHITTMVLKTFTLSAPIERSLFNYGDNEDVGIEDNPLTQIKVYPNPVKNVLRIDNPLNTELSYIVCNTHGVTIKKGIITPNSNTIDTPELNTGLYIIQLSDKQHNTSIKFLKN